MRRSQSSPYQARLDGLEPLERRLCLSAMGPFARIVQPIAVISNSDARVVGGVQTERFESVGIIGDRFGSFCSGTLITPVHVATAAHCAVGIGHQDGRFSVEGTTYATTMIHVHPQYNDFTLHNDIAVFHLNRPVAAVDPSPIFRGTPQVGQMLTLVGYGAGGTGESGHTGDFGTKRVGTTPIDGVEESLITWRFDNENESNTAPGDSGGAAFLTINEQYYLAGITSGGDRWDAGFGDNSFDTRVDAFADWIDANTETEAEDGTETVDEDLEQETTDETPADELPDENVTEETGDEQLVDEDNDKPEPPPLPGDDHADEAGPAATLISLEEGVGSGQGILEEPGDRDLFQLVFEESGLVTIQATSTDGWLDTYLRLYDDAGDVIAENDDFGGSFNSQLTLDMEAGTYYVDVGAYADWGIGEYQVDVQVVEAGLEPVESVEAIALNSVGGARLWDEIVSAGEVRSYSFVATVSGRMIVRTNQLSHRMDTMLTAYDSAGNELAFNDDWRGLKSRIRFDVQEGETYRVDVSGYRDSVGSYRLALRTKESSNSLWPPELATFPGEVTAEDVTVAVDDGFDAVAEAVTSTINQYEDPFNSGNVDAVWTETETLINETTDEISVTSSEFDEGITEVLEWEFGWLNQLLHSWFG